MAWKKHLISLRDRSLANLQIFRFRAAENSREVGHITNFKVGKYSPPIFTREGKALGSSLIVTPWKYFPGSSLILNPCEWNFRKKHLKFGTKSYIIDKPLNV